MEDFSKIDGKRATQILLTVNVLRRHLRDGQMGTYKEEIVFYANELKLPIARLRGLVELETAAIQF